MFRRVLAAHLEEGVGDLPEGAAPHRLHQHLEDVLVADDRLAEAFEHRRGVFRMPRLERAKAIDLALLLLSGRAGKGYRRRVRPARRRV